MGGAKQKYAAKRRPRTGAGSRKSGQGATRNAPAVKAQRAPSAWLNRVIILLGGAVVMAAAVQAYITLQAIPVQYITVTGELERTQTEAVQEMVQPALVGGFLKADLHHIRQQLEDLPWIYRATVQRKWPSALEINVIEQLPIARWGDDGFLNHEGEVFRSGSRHDLQSLPLLQGPDGTAKPLMAAYQRIVEILAPLHLAVTQLAVDNRGQMGVVLEGGMQLLLGSENFLERMHRFVALYRAELAVRSDQVERVDLRYENGVAVAFADPSHVAGI
jgi:cell division protein FtsQ